MNVPLIVLDLSNPGLWMAHCHIAEHAQRGMMLSFPVVEAGQQSTPPPTR